jgi:hypothetical protein
MDQRQRSDENPLDLIQADRIARAVIQPGRARRLAEGPRQRVVRERLRYSIVLPY